MEHLQPEDKEKFRNNGNVLQNILGFGEKENETRQEYQVSRELSIFTKHALSDNTSSKNIHSRFPLQRLDEAEVGGNVTLHEYFTEGYDLQGRNIGVPRDLSTKVRKFKVHMAVQISSKYFLRASESITLLIFLFMCAG